MAIYKQLESSMRKTIDILYSPFHIISDTVGFWGYLLYEKLKEKKKLKGELKKTVNFYQANFENAKKISQELEDKVQDLNGKTMNLEEAVEILNPIVMDTMGVLDINLKYKSIYYRLPPWGRPFEIVGFLIKYKYIK